MKKELLICLVSLLPVLSNAQNKHILSMNKMLDIRGAKGRNLIITDEESMSVNHLFSEHYVDSITGIPYTGLITINYNGNSVDSIYTVNGYKEGLCLNYHTKDTIIKSRIDYYDQGEGILISRNFPYSFGKYTTKDKYNYLSMRFFSEKVSVRISCVKKKTGWLVEVYEDDVKRKLKITSLEALKQLVGNYKSKVDLLELLDRTKALDKL